METLEPLSNLTSLTKLDIDKSGDLRGEGIWPLLAHGHLITLYVKETPKFFIGLEHEQELLCRSSELQELRTDDVAGILAAPICTFLSSSLTEFVFTCNKEVEGFTKEQEEALHLLTSLQELQFYNCDKLQFLPAGLNKLGSLKILYISSCPAIRTLPNDSLPSSLQKFVIWDCPALKSLPKDGLPSSLQTFVIYSCPALKSLPKDGLPSSLQELAIRSCPAIESLPKNGLPSSLRVLSIRGNSEELTRQCRRLTGTIPIIYS